MYLLFIAHNVRDVTKHLLNCNEAYIDKIPEIYQLVLLELLILAPLTWIRKLKVRDTILCASMLGA